MIYPIILSGGGGTRLWPLSRTSFPKQLLSPIGNGTLLQQTAMRVVGDQFEKTMVICHEDLRFLVQAQLQEIAILSYQIVLEPCTRNTLAAITIGCLLQENKENILLFMPADHMIGDPKTFQEKIFKGKKVATNSQKIILFGIPPRSPSSAYGYIEIEKVQKETASISHKISRFIEKPSLANAELLIKSNNCFWNSGIFLSRADVMLAEIQKFAPLTLEFCQKAVFNSKQDLGFLKISPLDFEKCPNISIDYGVIEKTSNIEMIQAEIEWSDIGSWKSVWELSPKDSNGNAFVGDVMSQDSFNCYVRSENLLVSLVGVDNLMIIESSDSVLVADLKRSEEIKEIAEQLKNSKRREADYHKRVYRPWGYFQSVDIGDRFQVKHLMIKPGARTSMQMHNHRSEHWVIVSGTARVLKGDKTFIVSENQSVYLPLGIPHRVENPGEIELHLIEIQSGNYLGEDDIVRLEDDYGRVS